MSRHTSLPIGLALIITAAAMNACAPAPTAAPPTTAPTATSAPKPAPPTALPPSPTSVPATAAPTATTAPTAAPTATAAPFTLITAAFTEGANIPAKFTCSAENVSPQLKWSGAPANTKSFALIMDDPDAPGGTFTHWVLFDIPASQNEFAEGKSVGKNGQNSARRTGYMGPCPPPGAPHRYYFTLYALDIETLGLNEGVARADVEKAMQNHILSKTQVMGRYAR